MSSTDAFVSEVADACKAAVLDDPAFERPSLLFHLTNTDGLIGILETKVLWASLATCLNDAMEIRYTVDLAKTMVEERLRSEVTEYDELLKEYLVHPPSVPAGLVFEIDPFVVSFCGRADKSGQWLHYGRSGHGIAIAFDPRIADGTAYDLIKVDYVPDSQRRRILSLVDAPKAALSGLDRSRTGPANMTRAYQLAAVSVAFNMTLLGARLKHPSFAEEDEYRLIGFDGRANGRPLANPTSTKPRKFRKSNGRLIPYEEFSFSSSVEQPFKSVVLGFSCSDSEDAVRVLISGYGYSPMTSRSTVPVR